MILTLVKEQLKTGRAAFAVAATMLAVTVGFAAFGVVYGASRTAGDLYVDGMVGDLSPYMANVTIFELNELADPTGATEVAAPEVTMAEFEDIINEARKTSPELTAQLYMPLRPSSGTPDYGMSSGTVLWASEQVWNALLSEGRAPGSREVVFSAALAKELHLSVGDSLLLEGGAFEDPFTLAVTVSGISHSVMGDSPYVASMFFSPNDAPLAAQLGAAEFAALSAEFGETTQPVVSIAWSSESVAIPGAEVQSQNTGYIYPYETLNALGASGWVVFGVLVFSCVVVAFSHARASASTRSAWQSTVRALGARRSQVLASAALEAALLLGIGLAGGVVGSAVGVAAFELWQGSLAAAPPTGVTFPTSLLLIVAALGAGLSLLIAGGPAIATVTTSPASALKNTAPADERQISRSVSVWPLSIALALCWGVVFAMVRVFRDITSPYFLLVAAAGLVLLIPLSVEGLRRLSRLWGTVLQRSSRPRHIYAGTVLAGHPRSYGAVALIPFALLAALAAYVTGITSAPIRYADYLPQRPVVSVLEDVNLLVTFTVPFGWAGLGIAALAIALLTIAAAVTTQVLTRTEQSVAAALGLSQTDIARAAALAASSMVGLGALAGAVVGTVLTMSLTPPVFGMVTHSFPAVTLMFVLATWLVSIPALWLVASAGRTRNDVTKASVNAR